MSKVVNKLLSREYFFYWTLFYLTCKLFPITQSISLLTYIMFAYAVLVFVYNRLIVRVDLSFPDSWFSYGIMIISIVSVLVNGYSNLRKVVIDIIPIFVNLFLFFPTFKYDNFEILFSQFKKIMQYIYVLGIFVSILNIANYIQKFVDGSIYKFRYRMDGIFSNTNLVGWFASVFLGSIIFNYIFGKKNSQKMKILNAFSFATCTICIVACQCRSVILAIVVFLLFFVLTTKRVNSFFVNHKLFTLSIITIVISIVFVGLLFLNGRFGSDREDIVRFALYVYNKNNKLFGLSYGRLREEWVNNYYSFFNISNNKPIRDIFAEANTHNIILQQLCTNGIVGFVLVCLFIVSLLKCIYFYIINYYNMSTKSRSFIFCLSYFVLLGLVVGMFDNSILQLMVIFMNFTFLVAAGFLLKISIAQIWGINDKIFKKNIR